MAVMKLIIRLKEDSTAAAAEQFDAFCSQIRATDALDAELIILITSIFRSRATSS